MRPQGRLCGALRWTTTVSLKLPRSNSPIRKEERLDQKLRTDCSLRLSLAVQNESFLRLGLIRPWLRRTNFWRGRTNLRTGSERPRGIGPTVAVAPPPTDAEVIAGCRDGHQSFDVSRETLVKKLKLK